MSKWDENTIRMYEGQDFEVLRAECHRKQQLFEDPLFPACARSLSDNDEQFKDIIWKRPREIVSNPQLIVNGIKRTDPTQGDLGNCWFIAAMSALTQNNLVLKRVIPPDQSFQSDWYAGIFHFRFWRYQQWYDVVIDDRLPYLTTEDRLWSARNTSELNEFWVPLLEKAYAKLNGSYSNLGGGLPVNALTDFTGGIEQRFEFKSNLSSTHFNTDDLFEFICSCIDYGSLIACSINPHDKQVETVLPNGLVIGHTYSITNYYLLAQRGILRLRNPWGNEIEWNGQWADHDPIWNLLDERTRQRLSIRNENDGEFWMSFDDFYREFDVMEVCHISPDTYDGMSLANRKYHFCAENCVFTEFTCKFIFYESENF